MSRPDVGLENYPRVYDYYEGHQQSRLLARLSIRLAGRGLNPSFSFDPGVHDLMRDVLMSDRTLVLAAHHVSHNDPREITQAPRHIPALKAMRGTTFVGAMHSLFIGNPVKRRIIDNLGSVPFFRPKDFDISHAHTRDTLVKASGAFAKASISKIEDQKQNMLIFPAGQTAANPLIVPDLSRSIIGRIVCGVTNAEQPLVVPVGVYYLDYVNGQGLEKDAFIHFGTPPVEGEFARKTQVASLLHPALQEATYSARQHGHEHSPEG